MTVQFEKYQGNGNDFVIIDDRDNTFNVTTEIISYLCNRRFGVGADGLIVIKEHAEADFEMQYFNSDGKPGTMCGNGGRCIAAFAFSKGITGEKMIFEAADGSHEAVINRAEPETGLFDVSLKLLPVNDVLEMENAWFIDSGSPHHIEFVECADAIDVDRLGMEIRQSDKYKPGGTNVDFVHIKDKTLFVRTFERGVEAETLSCGTGVTAAAMAAFLETGLDDWNIRTRGGDFTVSFIWDGKVFKDVWLQGPAKMVYNGKIEI